MKNNIENKGSVTLLFHLFKATMFDKIDISETRNQSANLQVMRRSYPKDIY